MEKIRYPLRIIKSKIILKCIFNFLEKRKKFILLNYNKVLQDIFGLSIDDYKEETNLIKICGFNGYGKEYKKFSHELIFEGNYLKGKKYGKGIEYYENGIKKTEGEYLNGKIIQGIVYDEKGNELFKIKNGNIIELYDNDIIKFKGEYLNNKRWNGKGYDYNGNEIYEIKNGNGYIKEYYPNGSLLFEGNYLKGLKNGEGKEYLHDKLIFEGNYLNGMRNGYGKEYIDDVFICKGEYINGKRWNGKEFDYIEKKEFDKMNKVEQMVVGVVGRINVGKSCLLPFLLNCNHILVDNNLLNKEKTFEIPLDNKYELVSENSNGSFKNIDNRMFKEYKYGELIFEGELINKERNGKGKEYFFDELIYEGEYMDGKRYGFGKEYYINNRIKYEGEFKNGNFDGKGKEYDFFGRLIFEGEYVNNKRWNGIIYKYSNNNFSKYEYFIPSKFFSKYKNKVPLKKRKEYFNKYHIKSSCFRHFNHERKLNDCKINKIIDNKTKNNWKKNKKYN